MKAEEQKSSKIINMVERKIQNHLEKMRPEIGIRDKVDIGYSFKDQTLELFEIRPFWNPDTGMTTDRKIHSPFVKTRFIKSRNIWKIYWLRASGKWEVYEPKPEVKDIDDVFDTVNEDKYYCFRG